MLRAVREADSWLRNERLTRSIPDEHPLVPIWLHVQSYGGDLLAGFSAADQLATIPTPIYSIVEGVCASAATVISITVGTAKPCSEARRRAQARPNRRIGVRSRKG